MKVAQKDGNINDSGKKGKLVGLFLVSYVLKTTKMSWCKMKEQWFWFIEFEHSLVHNNGGCDTDHRYMQMAMVTSV